MTSPDTDCEQPVGTATLRATPLWLRPFFFEQENNYYGHLAILRQYVGETRDRPLMGQLQHGWTATGFSNWRKPVPYSLRKHFTRYVWSERDADLAKGYLPVEIIGSPFLYLMTLLGPQVVDSRPKHGVLVFPPHTTEWDRPQAQLGQHIEIIRNLRRGAIHSFSSPVTICLYFYDYHSVVRKLYEAAGMRVVTVAASRRDPRYLVNLAYLIAQHAVVLSNLGSQAFYAAAMRRKLSTLTDDPQAGEMHSAFENLWSDLTGDVSTAHNRAVYELGIEHRLERADLRACLQFGGLSAATISFVGARLREEVRKKLLKEDSSQHLSLDPGASE